MANSNLAKNNNKHNIIDCVDLFEEKTNDFVLAQELIEQLKTRAGKIAIEKTDDIVKKKIDDLEKKINELENECMEKQVKLQACIPSGIIASIVICACMVAICLTMLMFQIVANTKIIDYYVILFVLVGSIGLLHTSIATIIGWKRYLNNEEK